MPPACVIVPRLWRITRCESLRSWGGTSAALLSAHLVLPPWAFAAEEQTSLFHQGVAWRRGTSSDAECCGFRIPSKNSGKQKYYCSGNRNRHITHVDLPRFQQGKSSTKARRDTSPERINVEWESVSNSNDRKPQLVRAPIADPQPGSSGGCLSTDAHVLFAR
jgi:hypothetical protein